MTAGVEAENALQRVADPASIVEDYLAEKRDDPRAHALAVRFLQMKQRPAEAAILLKESLRRFSEEPTLLVLALHSIPSRDVPRRLEVLRTGTTTLFNSPTWMRKYGEAASSLGHYEEASQAFHRTHELELNPTGAAGHEGRACEALGTTERAPGAYAVAFADEHRSSTCRLGVGVFFEDMGDWGGARRKYTEWAAQHPNDPQLWIKIAEMSSRLHDWTAAIVASERARELAPGERLPYFHLGYAQERLGAWEEAVKSYRSAAQRSDEIDLDSVFRAGHCLFQAGEFERSCSIFVMLNDGQPGVPVVTSTPSMSLENSAGGQSAHSDRFRTLGTAAAALKEWESAATWFRATVDHQAQHLGSDWYALGHALWRLCRFDEAAAAFVGSRIFRQAEFLPIERRTRDAEASKSFAYAEHRRCLPIAEKKIMWETSMGRSIFCHPLALFEHIVDDRDFLGHSHVWVIDSPDTPVPAEVRNRSDVVLVVRHSAAYLRHLATAKHLVNNTSFPVYFNRRPEQKYLNTWHGTPLKALGRSIRNEYLDSASVARNLLHTTHLATTNSHTSRVMLREYQVDQVWRGREARIGSARLDRMVTSTPEQITATRVALSVSAEERVVLYAPTWRESQFGQESQVDMFLAGITALRATGATVRFRAHHFTEKIVSEYFDADVIVPAAVDTYDALAAVDVLVTDYSSVLFDLLAINKPCVLFTPDLEDYTNDRGFSLDIRQLPLPRCMTPEELAATTRHALRDPTAFTDTSAYQKARQEFVPWEDGTAAERLARFFFHDDPTWDVPRDTAARAVLFHSSLIPDATMSPVLTLAASLERSAAVPHLVTSSEPLKDDSERRDMFDKIPANVRALGHVGHFALSLEQAEVFDYLEKFQQLENSKQREALEQGFRLEYRRVFADATFEAIVELDGHDEYWNLLAGAGSAAPSDRQHCETRDEHRVMFPQPAVSLRWQRRADPVPAEVAPSSITADPTPRDGRLALARGGLQRPGRPERLRRGSQKKDPSTSR